MPKKPRVLPTSKAEQKLQRHKDIVAYLAASTRPRTTKEVHDAVSRGEYVLRTTQRDLDELKHAGKVDAIDKEWVSVGGRLEEDIDRLLSVAALNIFRSILDESLPHSLKVAITALLEKKSALLMDRKYQYTPEINWLNSLRIEPGYSWVEKPIIDRSVRDGVEKAIAGRKKAWIRPAALEFGPWWYMKGEEVLVSISHYVLTLPDRPAIVAWREMDPDAAEEGMPADPRQTIWPLEFIESIRVTDEPAEIDADWEPDTSHMNRLIEPKEDWRACVIRINPLLLESMTGTTFIKRITDPLVGGEFVGTDNEGWQIHRLRVPPDPVGTWDRYVFSFRRFLQQNAQDVEVLEPFSMRMMQRRWLWEAARVLDENSQDSDAEIRKILWEKEDIP